MAAPLFHRIAVKGPRRGETVGLPRGNIRPAGPWCVRPATGVAPYRARDGRFVNMTNLRDSGAARERLGG
ncbi:hypothetical protein GCM10009642_01910 [Nocardiopsis metallicus]